jgi:acetyl esterase
MARVEDVKEIGVRVYTPPNRQDSCLVYFHGGGWVVCDLETHDVVCRAIAQQSGAVVVAVDYRLAPEHKFPAAVEDAYAAVLWAVKNVSSRISVGGDSAGGNLAAVMALKCRDEGGPRLASQVLIYPVTNLAAFDTASYREFAEGYNLTRSEMDWFRDCYLARPEDGHHPHASPLLAADLRGLPPALVITAECDVLRDEGEAYARRLEQAGVPVTCTRYPGMIHPFLSMPGALTQARKAIKQVSNAIQSR